MKDINKILSNSKYSFLQLSKSGLTLHIKWSDADKQSIRIPYKIRHAVLNMLKAPENAYNEWSNNADVVIEWLRQR